MSLSKCRQCGAPTSTPGRKFSCEYCGTINVDEEFFQSYAKQLESSVSDRFYQAGLTQYLANDFTEAEKSFNSCVTQAGAFPPEAWIYLALCKAHLVKSSNFDKNLSLTLQYLEKASQHADILENLEFSKIVLANLFLENATKATAYFFGTAEKKFLAFGEDKNAAREAFEEASKGFKAVQEVFVLGPNDADLCLGVVSYMLGDLVKLDAMGAPKAGVGAYKEFFVSVGSRVASANGEVFGTWLSAQDKKIQALFKKAESVKGPLPPVANVMTQQEASGVKKYLKPKILVPATLALLVVIGLSSGPKKDSSNTELSSAKSNTQVAESVNNTPQVSPQAQASEPIVPPTALNESLVSQAAVSQSGSAAPAETSPSPLPEVKAVSFEPVKKPDGMVTNALSTYRFKGPEGTAQLLTEMVQNSLNQIKIAELKGTIEAMPKPSKGDRKLARSTNDKALVALQQSRFDEAISLFQNAVAADPSDVEVKNNLAFAYLKANMLDQSEGELGAVLTLAPGRTSAWANLAEVYARKGMVDVSTATFLLAFQFSSNKDKTLTYLRGVAESNPDDNMKAAAANTLRKLSMQ